MAPSMMTRFQEVVRKFNKELLRSTCQVMKGCKPQKASLIADLVFERFQNMT